MAFAGILRQSTAVDVLIGPFVDSSDGDAEMTALTIAQADVRLSKNGQTAAQKNDDTTCAHDADGFYNCELDATDTNTVGQLTLYVHVSGALAVRHDFQVVEEVVYDQLFASSAPGAASTTTAAAIEADTQDIQSRLPAALVGGRIDANVGAVSADSTAADTLELFAEALDQATGQLDSGSLAAGTLTATAIAADAITAAKLAADVTTELQSGLATAAALTTVDTVVDGIKAVTDNLPDSGALTSIATAAALTTVDGNVDTILAAVVSLAVTTGAVQTNGSNSATSFETDLSETEDDHWKDAFLVLTSGDLSGQVKKVTAYNGTTKVITVSGGFTDTPADAVTFALVNR